MEDEDLIKILKSDFLTSEADVVEIYRFNKFTNIYLGLGIIFEIELKPHILFYCEIDINNYKVYLDGDEIEIDNPEWKRLIRCEKLKKLEEYDK